jgi:hypothetical protein
MWRYLVVRTLEVAFSPWRDASRSGVLGCARASVESQPLLETAVSDLLAALSPWPWRHARAAQLLGSLASALEGSLGRPARVADLASAPAAAWLRGLPKSERPFAEGLLRTLEAELTLWQDPGAYGARSVREFAYKRVQHEL